MHTRLPARMHARTDTHTHTHTNTHTCVFATASISCNTGWNVNLRDGFS